MAGGIEERYRLCEPQPGISYPLSVQYCGGKQTMILMMLPYCCVEVWRGVGRGRDGRQRFFKVSPPSPLPPVPGPRKFPPKKKFPAATQRSLFTAVFVAYVHTTRFSFLPACFMFLVLCWLSKLLCVYNLDQDVCLLNDVFIC